MNDRQAGSDRPVLDQEPIPSRVGWDHSINCQQQADVCTGKVAVIQRYDGQIDDVQ